jgi:cell division protein FtsW
LLAVGLVTLYSASFMQITSKGEMLGAKSLVSQMVWGAVGLVACGVIMCLDYQRLKKVAWPLFGLAVLLLVAVLIFGPKRNGAHRWLIVFGQSFQPSELAKMALILVVAWYGEECRKHMQSFLRGLVAPGIFIGLILGLIIVEPDFGTTALLAAVSVIMLILADARQRYIFPPVLLAVGILAAVVWHNDMRRERVLNWWYLSQALDDTSHLTPQELQRLEDSKKGVNHQAWEAMLAFGAGGVKGQGLGNGRQKQGFIPEHQTDFIFSVLGEELGLVATISVVVAFVVLVICGLVIAWNAVDQFGFLLAAGFTSLIGLQAFINLAVVTSLMPNKGLPLPFVSKGGSNLMILLACVGVILSVARQAGTQPATEAALMDQERSPVSQDT